MKTAESHTSRPHKKRRLLGLKIAFGIVIGLWIVVILALQLVLNTSFLTKMANKYAAEYVDGNISFGSINASMFKSFPNLNLSVDDFTLTYPHDRYAVYDSVGVKAFQRNMGRAMEADTLASFNKLTVSVNYMRLLSGKVVINDATLDRVRLYAHDYGNSTANWNIFKFEPGDDPTGTGNTLENMPHIVLHHVALTGKPRIVYTAFKDTLFATVQLEQTVFGGSINLASPKKNRIGFHMDSLFVAGRLPADTLAFAMDYLRLRDKHRAIAFDARAKVLLAMRSLGRLNIPIALKGELKFPERSLTAVSLRNLNADIATMNLTGDAKVKMNGDSIFVDSKLSLNSCPIEETVDFFAANIMPEALNLKTDASLTATMEAKGWYNSATGSMPQLSLVIDIPQAAIGYEGIDQEGIIALNVSGGTDKDGAIGVDINKLVLNVFGASLEGTGSGTDLLGADPLVKVDMTADVSLDEISDFLPEGMNAGGSLAVSLKGSLRTADLADYDLSRVELDGFIRSEGITVNDEVDTLYAYVGSTGINIGKSERSKEHGLIDVAGTIDSLYATLNHSTFIRGKDISLTLGNTVEADRATDEVMPLVGIVNAGNIGMRGEDSLFVGIRNTKNTFRVAAKKKEGQKVPVLSFTSENGGLFIRQGVNRIIFRDAAFTASAVKNVDKKKQQMKQYMDSLRRAYPGVSRDSLMRQLAQQRMAGRPMPSFLTDDDFKDSNISFSIDESVSNYVKNWDIFGKLTITGGGIITPYFPLRNQLSDVEGTFNTNEVDIKGIKFSSGRSNISATGKLSGFKPLLMGRPGIIRLELDVNSERILAGELLRAYDAGTKFSPKQYTAAMDENVSDDDYLATVVVADTLDSEEPVDYSLIVIPANLVAKITLNGDYIKYSDLEIDSFKAMLNMRERTLQLTGARATSNMGEISLEAFYATRSKDDIKAGFNLNMNDITADKVITLFPAVDSIMPMLKSFSGMLNCELAATTELDTAMTILPSTMDGILRISGKNLQFVEEGDFKKIAKLLLFKNKDVGLIDDMSVEGIIADNTLEVFPFILSIDRYTLAMSGLQNFDQSFTYHISVLKSPIPFRFGINLTGNFDDWKYKVGKAKYKDTNVPVFSSQIDTMQVNLVSSIRNIFTKGVDRAINDQTSFRKRIEQDKRERGYSSFGDIDSLSAEEQFRMDSLNRAMEAADDSMVIVAVDTLAAVQTPDGISAVEASIKDRIASSKKSMEDFEASITNDAAIKKERKKAALEASSQHGPVYHLMVQREPAGSQRCGYLSVAVVATALAEDAYHPSTHVHLPPALSHVPRSVAARSPFRA